MAAASGLGCVSVGSVLTEESKVVEFTAGGRVHNVFSFVKTADSDFSLE